MSNVIKNGAPQNVNLGAYDRSIKPTPPKPIVISTHTALIFSYSAGGPATKELVDGGRLLALYGKETFDRALPYFGHGTRLAEIVSGAGNSLMMTRIIPQDNNTISNVTLYADVLQDTVNVYQRNDDGSYATDAVGAKIISSTVTGYRLKFVTEVNADDILTPIGVKSTKVGYMTTAGGATSSLIPILEQRAAYKGKKYDNYGFTISLPTVANARKTIISGTLSLPYEYGIVKRANVNSTGTFISNVFAAPFDQFAFKLNGKDSVTNSPVDINKVVKKWYSTNDPLRDLVYPVLDAPFVYRTNLNSILNNLLVAEQNFANVNVTTKSGATINTGAWLDFVTTAPITEQAGLINLFTAKSINNVPAFTFEIDTTAVTLAPNQKDAYFSKSTPIYLGGGKDGTLSKANFEAGVSLWMGKYLDRNSEVMDPAINIENVLYDSGYTLPTKEDLVNFITVRKNTFLALGTHIDDGDNYATLDYQRAIGVSLKARLALAPESTFFNTHVARGIIVVGSGLDRNDPENKRYPLTMDIAGKAARMMGGAKWNRNLIFDTGAKNIITNYTDVEPKFIPGGIIADLWDIGLIWPANYDRSTSYFPALQSVYDNDTSVMNNFYAGMALTVDNNIASAVWRTYTGNVSLKPAEFVAAVEEDANKRLNGVFDGVIKATARVEITDFDAARGYSHTLISSLTGNVMRTVQTHYTEMYNNKV